MLYAEVRELMDRGYLEYDTYNLEVISDAGSYIDEYELTCLLDEMYPEQIFLSKADAEWELQTTLDYENVGCIDSLDVIVVGR